MSIFLSAMMLIPCGSATTQAAKSGQEEAKFEPETFYLVMMRRTPSWNGDKAAKLGADQNKYWQAVAGKSMLLAGGPTTEVKDTMAAVMVLRSDDKREAATIANDDPLVKNKLWSSEVYPWMTQKGLFSPITRYEPDTPYYLGILKRGEEWSPEETSERQRIQDGHMANIKRLYEAGKLVAAGPFLEDGDLRGIFVFRVASMEEALTLTNTDPAVQARRLRIELYPWQLPKAAFARK